MILLLDIGNTRIKWAQLENGALSAQSAATHAEDRMQVFDRIGQDDDPPRRILVSNVGGPAIAAACSRTFNRRWNIQPEFSISSAHAAGVTNAYREPEKLGVDRWLAVIAAHSMNRGAACIVSVGTAMTIDGVDASGMHLGGLIVPGPDLMISSLLTNTSDIASRMGDEPAQEALFASHTLGAVHQGCLHALAALVDRAANTMQSPESMPLTLLLTGGAAARLSPLIQTPHEQVEDLVLRGLALLAV